MSQNTIRPDLTGLEIPMDSWTQPFWDAAAARKLVLPRCADCGRFRWPPGPFCPACQSQHTEWASPGDGRIYSFTIVPDRAAGPADAPRQIIPALIEFPGSNGVRMLAAIVDTPPAAVRIGAKVALGWSPAANATVPVFTIPM